MTAEADEATTSEVDLINENENENSLTSIAKSRSQAGPPADNMKIVRMLSELSSQGDISVLFSNRRLICFNAIYSEDGESYAEEEETLQH